MNHRPVWQWVALGQPCPLCEWAEPHLHQRRSDDGTYGIVVRMLALEPEGGHPSTPVQSGD